MERYLSTSDVDSGFYRQPAGTILTELPRLKIIYTEIGKQCQNDKFSIKYIARSKSLSLSFPKGFYATNEEWRNVTQLYEFDINKFII